jgi:transcription elongation factor GreB
MSKAFVRESDSPFLPEPPPFVSPLPPGAKNYLTPDGFARLSTELEGLRDRERPPLAAAPADDLEAKQRLQALDQKIRHLAESLRTAVVVERTTEESDVVRFGATVVVRDAEGDATYRIVGVDEIDLERGWISWLSPMARALLNARIGQRIVFKAPKGPKELTIVRIDDAA